ncbi:PKS-NRPS hybrid synthetase [Fusarium oxysporum f. sp. cubense]|nr:PKS-NRPS hybrid synthetase [Fusarium oxysporum f. sp. cubense]TVY74054.1 PKS-NRPS hybrid synthetase [Fusarium oxysporum f. sp. cubense]TVY74166.1 PKS-NRPS hybrid synthetase [Fusarium oxysporum f. sp. cubense]
MDPTDVLNRFPDDVLPPEGEFPSRKDLVTAINAWARDRGYAFVVKNSWKTSSGRTGVIYCCDRGTKPASTTKIRKRNTTSRYTGCLFSVIAKEEASRTAWSLKYRPDHSHHEHNHEPSNALAHPTHRQLSSPDRSIVRQLANAGATPKVITSHLRNTTGTLATQKDIYNCIAQSKRELVQGQSNIHALIMQLESEGFWNRIRLDDSRVTAVLFAHPKSLEYLKSYPEVLILDCTYKTNKYNMPLLNAIGVDACQRSFCIAFAFLSGEEEADYQWVLIRLQSLYEAMAIDFPSVILTDRCLACMNAVASTFPQSVSLLCLWHINKAVLRHCMDAFTKDSKDYEGQKKWKEFYSLWHDLVASSNEDIYYQKLGEFKKKYLPDYISQIGYITETWLDLYKDRFVKAWVDQHLHFNQFVTSRCEGIHQLIKSYLKTSQLNLFEAWRYIKLVVMNQLAELDSNRAKQQASFPLKLSGSIYGNIRGWISHEALRLVESQRSRLLHELPSCTGTFNRTLGLPCAHTIQPLIYDNQPLQIYHFHSHWRIQRNGNPQLLIEPAIQSSRLQATSVLPVTSTQREPCAFEAVENTIRPRAPPTCSKCHQSGHKMKSKACPLRWEHISQTPTQASITISPTQASTTIVPTQTSTTVHTVTHTVSRSTTRSLSPASPAGVSAVHTTTETTTETTTQITTITMTSPVAGLITVATQSEADTLSYEDPRAIYQRYKADREAWYATLPRGAVKTNQQYRKAMKLPQRYSKAEYEWCVDWKQMGRHCRIGRSTRDWTKEEMMSYLDFDKAENERVERNVEKELQAQRFTTYRGSDYVWKAAGRDHEDQQQVYQHRNHRI